MKEILDKLEKEFLELDTKIEKLDDFIIGEAEGKTDKCNKEEFGVLCIQLVSMDNYRNALMRRMQILRDKIEG